MKRRDFLKGCFAIGATGLLAGRTRGQIAPPLTRPNILWISLEDITPMMGCYGDEYARTPVFDSLAAEGIRYTRAHSVSPVCSPSRSSVITGMYPTSLGSMHHRSNVQPPEFLKMLLMHIMLRSMASPWEHSVMQVSFHSPLSRLYQRAMEV